MVSGNTQNLVYNFKISSVGPARVTGSDVVHEPNGIDLAMKLHYLKIVFFFSSEASHGMTISRIKESMFYWLNDYYVTCSRFRRSEAGRLYMKCNDCGARMVEAQCDITLDEWLEMRNGSLNNKLLVYHLPIGPELSFSPLLYFQVTKFKCGGFSLGLSWAHILGDPFSASYFMNTWSPFLHGLKYIGPLKLTKSPMRLEKSEITKEPLSLKRVDPVGDHWMTANNCKVETFSLYLTASQVSCFLSKIWGENSIKEAPLFESLCSIMWRCVAKVREGHEPKVVTICRKNPNYPNDGVLSNNQIISSVQVDFSIVDSTLKTLATLLMDGVTDEKNQIEDVVEKDNGTLDYIVYGANLTFVDLEKADLYGLELNGLKPKFVHYSIQGVGDEGAVLLLPWPEDGDKDGENGKVLMVILPENEVTKLKCELKENGLLVENDLE